MIKTSAIGSCVRCRDVSGFTLIELLVVLVIMVLLVGAVPLAINRLVPGYQLRAAVEQLMNEFRRANELALAHGQLIDVRCAETVYSIDSVTRATNKSIQLPPHSVLSCFSEPDGREIHVVHLFPDGSATSSSLVITDGRRSAKISVNATTGRVQVSTS